MLNEKDKDGGGGKESTIVGRFIKRMVDDFRQKHLMPIKLLFFVQASTLFVLYPFLTIHMKELGIGVEEAAAMNAITPLVAIFMPPLAGMAADRIGNFRVQLSVLSAIGGGASLLLMLVPAARHRPLLPPQVLMVLEDTGAPLHPWGEGGGEVPLSLLSVTGHRCSFHNSTLPPLPLSVIRCGHTCPVETPTTISPHPPLHHENRTSVFPLPGERVFLPDDLTVSLSCSPRCRLGRPVKPSSYRRLNGTTLIAVVLSSNGAIASVEVEEASVTERVPLEGGREGWVGVIEGEVGAIGGPEEGTEYLGRELRAESSGMGMDRGAGRGLEGSGGGRVVSGSGREGSGGGREGSGGGREGSGGGMEGFGGDGKEETEPGAARMARKAVSGVEPSSAWIAGGGAVHQLQPCRAACLVSLERVGACADLAADDYIVNNPQLTFWSYLAVRVLIGAIGGTAFAMFEGAVIALLRRHGADYGLQRMYAALGGMVASPLSGLLLDSASTAAGGATDFRPAFYLYAGLKVLCGLLVLTIDLEFKAPAQHVIKDVMSALRNLELVAIFGASLALGAAWGFLEGFLFWLLQDLGASRTLMGLTVTVGGAAGLPLLALAGPITDRIGHHAVIAISFVIYAIRLLGYSLLRDPWLCLVFEAMEGVTSSLATTAAVTAVASRSTTSTDSSLQGLLGGLYYGVGKGIGSLVGGLLMGVIGTQNTFRLFSGTCAIVGFVYLWFSRYVLIRPGSDNGKKKEKEEGGSEMQVTEVRVTKDSEKRQEEGVEAGNK